jgi:hypothetical protein
VAKVKLRWFSTKPKWPIIYDLLYRVTILSTGSKFHQNYLNKKKKKQIYSAIANSHVSLFLAIIVWFIFRNSWYLGHYSPQLAFANVDKTAGQVAFANLAATLARFPLSARGWLRARGPCPPTCVLFYPRMLIWQPTEALSPAQRRRVWTARFRTPEPKVKKTLGLGLICFNSEALCPSHPIVA